VGAEAELGRVGLADDDAARRLHPLDHQRIVVGNVVGEQRRAERARDPFRFRGILDRLRHAVHPAEAFAARERRVAPIRLPQQAGFVLKADDRIDLRVDGGDAIERRAHDLAARHLLGVDRARKRVGVEVGDLHGRFLSRRRTLSASRTSSGARSPT
jgi:hypothetical protein